MSGWRQAVFLRQRLDVIQRALAEILDEEAWSPATPRRLYIGGADASSRGWTMIVPELADFFLDHGGRSEPRLARLARALRCPGYEVDVRDPDALALHEVDERGRMRLSGARRPPVPGGDDPRASPVASFGLIAMTDEIAARIAALAGGRATALADYLGAIVGFPGWTRSADDPITAGELVYEPPRIIAAARLAEATEPSTETRAASARTPLRAAPASFDRRGRRPRSVSRSRR
ncbi:MAG TPA: hypothetical protein VHT91_18380 [Kofleriaceae bacterium]|jgi:hypothetical protein|nr:hypothetical protein [Kofleriaceae bacterium]